MFQIARTLSNDTELSKRMYMQRVAEPPPSCVHMVRGTKVCYIRYNKMEEAEAQISDLGMLVAPSDVTVVNFGLHHNAEDLEARLPGLLGAMKAHPSLGHNLYFRDTPPQHFDTPYGLYPGGTKPPFQCKALQGVWLQPDGALGFDSGEGTPEWSRNVFVHANARNIKALPVAESLGIPVMHTFNVTAALHDFHRDNGDGHECSHFCFPVPLIWVDAMVKTLQAFPPTTPRLAYVSAPWQHESKES
jgi:hypothetical protein